MAHFAEIGLDNTVLRVIVVSNSDCLDSEDNEVEEIGAEFCRNLLGGIWKQTSYNATFRKNYAGIGYTYNSLLDAFIPPQPYLSWILNTELYNWEAPVPIPEGSNWTWNEELQQWDQIPVDEFIAVDEIVNE